MTECQGEGVPRGLVVEVTTDILLLEAVHLVKVILHELEKGAARAARSACTAPAAQALRAEKQRRRRVGYHGRYCGCCSRSFWIRRVFRSSGELLGWWGLGDVHPRVERGVIGVGAWMGMGLDTLRHLLRRVWVSGLEDDPRVVMGGGRGGLGLEGMV